MFKQYFLVSIIFFSSGCEINPAPTNMKSGISVVPTPTPVKPDDIQRINLAEDKFYWSERVGNSELKWNKKDLFFNHDLKTHEIFSSFAKSEYQKLKDLHSRCRDSHFFSLLSVVGGIVSFQHERGIECGSSPSAEWRYTTIDLDKIGRFGYPDLPKNKNPRQENSLSSKVISLTDLFAETDILSGLLENPTVADTVSKNQGRRPSSLSEFTNLFNQDSYSLIGEDFELKSDFLSRFAFHHIVEGNAVAIWISLSPKSRANQADQEHLEIVLPITEKLEKPLILASTKQNGFLMMDASSISGKNYSEFEFGHE